ncbi:MAG: hypothetical protein KAX24_01890 [Anaerolineae bacterium]|nr:hypothetical protein [Anaerolineae bacterium]
MAEKHGVDERVVFQIKMQGKLDDRWSDWFNSLTVVVEGKNSPITTLIGPTDQAGLRGILNRIWDLNLKLISVVPIETHVQLGGDGR